MLLQCLTIGLLITLACVSSTEAVSKTARDKNELAGPVRSVVTMTPGFSEAATYDRTGNLIEAVIYQQHERRSTRYVFIYDQQGAVQHAGCIWLSSKAVDEDLLLARRVCVS